VEQSFAGGKVAPRPADDHPDYREKARRLGAPAGRIAPAVEAVFLTAGAAGAAEAAEAAGSQPANPACWPARPPYEAACRSWLAFRPAHLTSLLVGHGDPSGRPARPPYEASGSLVVSGFHGAQPARSPT
jgi:hypothetical protein